VSGFIASPSLTAHAARLKARRVAEIADAESDRSEAFGFTLGPLHADFSRQKLDREALAGLISAASEAGFEAWRARLFAGEPVNATEGRPALHMAWRAADTARFTAYGEDVMSAVAPERDRMSALAEDIRAGRITGATGRPLRHILHLGIGGSDLGPRLVYEALKHHRDPQITLRLAANIDPAELNDALEGLDPETTLVIIVSKSFSTQETLANARAARAWLAQHLQDDAAADQHLAAVSAAPEKARGCGVPQERIFGFQDWVGGRYSLWSSVGLSLEIALAPGAFAALRAGAAAMDDHFLNAPAAQNLPLIKALTDVWNAEALGYPSRCVAPYTTRLRLLPNFLQQLEMESNGKRVGADGAESASIHPVVWGAEGSNAQHAFFQQLHQGVQGAPVDFIAPIASHEAREDMHRALLANCLAQGEALMRGRDADAVAQEMRAAGASEEEIARLTPHRICPGGRPSMTILLDDLTPDALGHLLALFEHKTAAQGFLMGVNSFDQFGVELGKTLASRTLPVLGGEAEDGVDAITADLIRRIRR